MSKSRVSRLRLATLAADMRCFLRANRAAVFADFVRWYSPANWVVEDERRHALDPEDAGDTALSVGPAAVDVGVGVAADVDVISPRSLAAKHVARAMVAEIVESATNLAAAARQALADGASDTPSRPAAPLGSISTATDGGFFETETPATVMSPLVKNEKIEAGANAGAGEGAPLSKPPPPPDTYCASSSPWRVVIPSGNANTREGGVGGGSGGAGEASATRIASRTSGFDSDDGSERARRPRDSEGGNRLSGSSLSSSASIPEVPRRCRLDWAEQGNVVWRSAALADAAPAKPESMSHVSGVDGSEGAEWVETWVGVEKAVVGDGAEGAGVCPTRPLFNPSQVSAGDDAGMAGKGRAGGAVLRVISLALLVLHWAV